MTSLMHRHAFADESPISVIFIVYLMTINILTFKLIEIIVEIFYDLAIRDNFVKTSEIIIEILFGEGQIRADDGALGPLTIMVIGDLEGFVFGFAFDHASPVVIVKGGCDTVSR